VESAVEFSQTNHANFCVIGFLEILNLVVVVAFCLHCLETKSFTKDIS